MLSPTVLKYRNCPRNPHFVNRLFATANSHPLSRRRVFCYQRSPLATAILPQFAHSELRPGRVVSEPQEGERREKSNATPVSSYSHRNDCTVSCHRAVREVCMSWKTRKIRSRMFWSTSKSQRAH